MCDNPGIKIPYILVVRQLYPRTVVHNMVLAFKEKLGGFYRYIRHVCLYYDSNLKSYWISSIFKYIEQTILGQD